jgi:hypothetical protein
MNNSYSGILITGVFFPCMITSRTEKYETFTVHFLMSYKQYVEDKNGLETICIVPKTESINS